MSDPEGEATSGGVRVRTIETTSLGDRSYVVTRGSTAVVVDPQRDIDRVLEVTAELGVDISHVLETHLHNDYVSGGLELSRESGAEYVVPAGPELRYPARRSADGDVIDAGGFTLDAVHTPGHTDHHVSYVLRGATEPALAVFSGGSMLFDATGRTDLAGPEHTRRLTRAQFHSVRRLAGSLPGSAALYPTHGFGSFCAAGSVGLDASTVAEQAERNPALTKDEATFVAELLDSLGDVPAYYQHMAGINASNAQAGTRATPDAIDLTELRRRISRDEWVVDLRDRLAFAGRHLHGSKGFEFSDSFVTYLGWLFDWGRPINLIGSDEDQIAQATRDLFRIGIDGVVGVAAPGDREWAAATDLRTYDVATFEDLAAASRRERVHVVDVRRSDEFAARHVRGAVNVPVHELAAGAAELDGATLWVHCASGYRASVAASLLDAANRSVVLVDDDFATAVELDLTE